MADDLFANYADLLVAIIKMAHRDSIQPNGCTPRQVQQYQADAQQFLAWLRSGNWVETAPMPLTSQTLGGRGRWAMDELDLDNRAAALAWRRQKQALAGADAGRIRRSLIRRK